MAHKPRSTQGSRTRRRVSLPTKNKKEAQAMRKITDILIDLIPFVIVGALAIIAISQYADAQRELEQSRSACYAQIGKEACENVR